MRTAVAFFPVRIIAIRTVNDRIALTDDGNIFFAICGNDRTAVGIPRFVVILLRDHLHIRSELDVRGNFIDLIVIAIVTSKKLRALGMTIVCVTHDVEFAADCADRCAMFFRGEITSCSSPKEFFSGNSFYTTAANRMTRGYYGGVTTVADAVEIMKKNGAATK